jgi:phage shock protein A
MFNRQHHPPYERNRAMQWLDTFSLVIRTSISSLREKVQDPERMLHQLIADMEEEMDRVRESVAAAIADEIHLGKKAEQARQETEQWLKRATSAIERGDETASQAALEQKLLAEERALQLEREYAKQKEQTAKLQRAVADLNDKIRQARQKRTLLLARLARADSTTRINRALDRSTKESAFAEFGRLEQRVERAEAMSEAYDRLEGRDPQTEELERKFDEADRKERLEREFEELKSRVGRKS